MSIFSFTAFDQDAPIQAWREDSIVRLRFNRPESLNAINVPMAEAFLKACRGIAAEPGVRVVVVSGAGRAFMAGGDVAAMSADPVHVAKKLIANMHAGLSILTGLPAPVVAQVHGAVAGGGLGVLLACDLVIASDATKINLAYPSIGASADCGTTWGLPRVVGLRKAMQIALLSEPIAAPQALELGLLNEVVPASELDAVVEACVRKLAAGPTLALGSIKSLLRNSFERSMEQSLHAEEEEFIKVARSEDFAHGADAFLMKRSPVFQGR